MHLAEMIGLRTMPMAGLLLALTERCPLTCAHCSTNSTMGAREYGADPVRRLIATFTLADHPQLILMSGGEPLLRPGLVAELATVARSAGTRSCLLSGMYFARGRMPTAIRRAIGTLDHFSASVDVFHEREVARADVFAALGLILDLVPAVSVHVTGVGTGVGTDTYLDDLLAQLRRAFGDRIPALVGTVQATGRARSFTTDRTGSADPGPCEFANWPLVDVDGTVYACSRQSLARRHRPDHLTLGHAAVDSWSQLRARAQAQPVLRSVRTLGALETARRAGVAPCAGACETCVGLPTGVQPPPAGVEQMSRQLLRQLTPVQLARRWGAGEHAGLVELGWSR